MTYSRPSPCWPPAPRFRKAVRDAKKAGHAYVIVDGTLIPIDRVAADRPFYSGKHKKPGHLPVRALRRDRQRLPRPRRAR